MRDAGGRGGDGPVVGIFNTGNTLVQMPQLGLQLLFPKGCKIHKWG